jgi:hypothetical protein
VPRTFTQCREFRIGSEGPCTNCCAQCIASYDASLGSCGLPAQLCGLGMLLQKPPPEVLSRTSWCYTLCVIVVCLLCLPAGGSYLACRPCGLNQISPAQSPSPEYCEVSKVMTQEYKTRGTDSGACGCWPEGYKQKESQLAGSQDLHLQVHKCAAGLPVNAPAVQQANSYCWMLPVPQHYAVITRSLNSEINCDPVHCLFPAVVLLWIWSTGKQCLQAVPQGHIQCDTPLGNRATENRKRQRAPGLQ